MNGSTGESRLDLTHLGERLVRAARLAAAIHLFDASRIATEPFADSPHAGVGRQRVVIGGAGPLFVRSPETHR